MLGNCEKTVIVSPTIHKLPQNQIDEKGLMASSTGSRVMEKPSQQDQIQQQQALKCPRCDSSNTKFCYYNNYSLSQPRHFCKACKRYWTKGGTLRNVPVGGGCRKNKRTKRPPSAIDAPSSSSSPPTPPTTSSNPTAQPQIDLSSSSTTHITPLFYGLPTHPSELTLRYPRFNSRVSSVDAVSRFDLHPQLNALGLGFSSGLMNGGNGFHHHPNKQIQAAAAVTSNSLLSSYSLFGSSTSSSSSSSASPTMASLLASTIQQQKFISNGLKDIREASSFHHQGLMLPYQELQMPGNGESGNMVSKEMKMEEGPNRLDWNLPFQNQIDQTNPSDPSVYWNGISVGGAWLDPANIGSSVSSLI